MNLEQIPSHYSSFIVKKERLGAFSSVNHSTKISSHNHLHHLVYMAALFLLSFLLLLFFFFFVLLMICKNFPFLLKSDLPPGNRSWFLGNWGFHVAFPCTALVVLIIELKGGFHRIHLRKSLVKTFLFLRKKKKRISIFAIVSFL